jgi:GNAT superfamily N-acetyltransferase
MSGSGANVGGKAVEFSDSSNRQKEIGTVDVSIDGKGNAKLLRLFVTKTLRKEGIGSKMLQMLIDFIKDGIASEINGDITGADELDVAKLFCSKHGFTISNEGTHTLIYTELTKPPFSEFFTLHNVEKQFGKKWVPT